MSNEEEIYAAFITKGIPGLRHILSTGLPLMSETSATIKGLQYENGQLRKQNRELQDIADGRMDAMEILNEEIRQLNGIINALHEEQKAAKVAHHFIVSEKNDRIKELETKLAAAQRDSKSASDAMHRMWNSFLTGGDRNG